MQEIIKISENRIGDSSVNSVSARELHKRLGVKKQFTQWAEPQIKRAGLQENIDFINVWHDTQKGIVNYISEKELLEKFSNVQQATRNGFQSDYILTMESAKHIAMMSGTQKGKEVRNYFIKVEETYKLQISKPKTEKRDDIISVAQSELDKELQTLKFILDNFNLSENEKITFTNQTLEKINFQTLKNPALKKREPVFTLTKLLKEFQISILPKDFNPKLESFGIVKYSEDGWEIIDMRFGENRKYQDRNNPKYYKSTFQELLDIVLET